MQKIGDFPTPPGSSADDPSASSAGASFSVGPPVGSDNYVRMPRTANGWVRDGPGIPRARNWVRAGTAPVVDNAAMAGLQRAETTIGPLAHEGRTITLVARTTALHLGGDGRGALHVRSRPAHVEVLDEDGRRHVVHIRDVEYAIVATITVATIASTYVLRLIRKSRRSSQ